MLRRLFTFMTILSLLLCVVTCVLWVRSGSPSAAAEPDELSAFSTVLVARWTLMSEPGRLTLFLPPRTLASPAGTEAQQLADGLSLSHLSFRVEMKERIDGRWMPGYVMEDRPEGPRPRCYTTYPQASSDSPLAELTNWPPNNETQRPVPQRTSAYSASDLVPRLLLALEEPDRFAVAHVVLQAKAGTGPRNPTTTAPEGSPRDGLDPGWFVVTVDGLRLRCYSAGASSIGANPGDYVEEYELAGPHAAADQLPQVRRRWHRHFDAPAAGVPYWVLAGAFAVMPTMRGGVAAWSLRRRRMGRGAGRCSACGYNLRASPDRCPECGAVPASVTSSV